MNLDHFSQVVQAEIRKLFGRTASRVGLVAALLVGLLPMVRVILRLVELAVVEPGVQLPPIDAPFWCFASLAVRNWLVMKFLLIMVGALSVAGEFQNRTLREDLLRPVPRRAVLAAKWIALSSWVGVTLLITFVSSAFVSIAMGGFQNGAWLWSDTIAAYATTLLGDIGFAAFVIAAGVLIRSVAGTMGAMVLFYILDSALWAGLHLMGFVNSIPKVARDVAEVALPWLPSAAFGVWSGPMWGGWTGTSFLSLGILSLVAVVVAERVFARTDVP
jgi:ABC-type transport system involved in multi-copper enzyme maturation permease subunit